MRANKPPRRKRPFSASTDPSAEKSRGRIQRLWFFSMIFALATFADVWVLMHYRDRLPFEDARLVVISIFVLFVCCELCAVAAVLMWAYKRIENRKRTSAR
jgi:hypothetical protein